MAEIFSGLEQRPQKCACRFEWRPMPDFSGAPPVQVEKCGFHSEQEKHFQERIATLEAALSEAQRDAERLEWMLEKLASGDSIVFDPKWLPPPPYTNRDSMKAALRKAIDNSIDAARTQGERK